MESVLIRELKIPVNKAYPRAVADFKQARADKPCFFARNGSVRIAPEEQVELTRFLLG